MDGGWPILDSPVRRVRYNVDSQGPYDARLL